MDAAYITRLTDEQRGLRDSLEKELNLQPTWQYGLAFKMAWEEGHSSGEEEIRQKYQELIELCQTSTVRRS